MSPARSAARAHARCPPIFAAQEARIASEKRAQQLEARQGDLERTLAGLAAQFEGFVAEQARGLLVRAVCCQRRGELGKDACCAGGPRLATEPLARDVPAGPALQAAGVAGPV